MITAITKESASLIRQKARRHLPQSYLHSSLTKWLVLGGIVIVEAVWIKLAGFHFVGASVIGTLFLIIMLLALGWTFLCLRNRGDVFVFADSAAFIVGLAACGSLLSYLVMSLNMPLVDRYLSAADYAVGIDWPSYYRWMSSQLIISQILNFAYSCWLPQWLAIPLLLSFRHERRVRELTSLAVIISFATAAVSLFLPAISAIPYYFPEYDLELQWLQAILSLRNGSLTSLDLSQIQGIVTIPSFHTIGSVIFIYVLRGIKVLFPMGVLLNGLIILSTPASGSHYIVDVIAGVIVAILCILLYRNYPSLARLAVPVSWGSMAWRVVRSPSKAAGGPSSGIREPARIFRASRGRHVMRASPDTPQPEAAALTGEKFSEMKRFLND